MKTVFYQLLASLLTQPWTWSPNLFTGEKFYACPKFKEWVKHTTLSTYNWATVPLGYHTDRAVLGWKEALNIEVLCLNPSISCHKAQVSLHIWGCRKYYQAFWLCYSADTSALFWNFSLSHPEKSGRSCSTRQSPGLENVRSLLVKLHLCRLNESMLCSWLILNFLSESRPMDCLRLIVSSPLSWLGGIASFGPFYCYVIR